MIASKIQAMRSKEESLYLFINFYKPPSLEDEKLSECINVRDDLTCRAKICHWTYSVIDHFNLSRSTVAISIDLFDRFLATRGNRCDTNLALLTSLTTLYIAIKVNEQKKIKLCTLARLSRQQFSPQDIEKMEMEILKTLSWLIHPPTALDFISHLIMLLPSAVSGPTRHDVFDMSRYITELSVCDPYFTEHHKSNIALATILNVLEDEITSEEISRACREKYLINITGTFDWFNHHVQAVNCCRDRLRRLQWEQEESPSSQSSIRTKRAHSPTSVLG